MKADIDIKLINEEILDIYIESLGDNPQLNFTWSVVSFKGRNLILDLHFNHS